MNLIATLTEKDIYPQNNITPESEYIEPREAVRIVIFNDEGKISLGTFKDINKNLCYSAIGGGIDDGETKEEALFRESLEEAGCRIKNVQELGIIEERGIGSDKKGRFIQTNYCYIAEATGEKIPPRFTEEEINLEFGLSWFPLDEAISKLKAQGNSFLTRKTLILLEEAKRLRGS